MISEANLWKATWKRNRQDYVLSLSDYPEIKVTGSILDEAIEKLEDTVAEKLGDANPHFEFLTPLPLETQQAAPCIHILTGHKCADDITNIEQLFVRERCSKCQNYSGPRTDALMRLDSAPRGDITFTDFLGQIVSSRISDFLNLGDSTEMELRPLVLRGKETTDYLELRSKCPREYVALKGVKAEKGGFRCGACGFVVWMYMPYEAPFSKYVAKESLPHDGKQVFPIGVDDRVRLAVDHETRAAVIRSKRFKNIVSQRVGVLTPDQAAPIESFFK